MESAPVRSPHMLQDVRLGLSFQCLPHHEKRLDCKTTEE